MTIPTISTDAVRAELDQARIDLQVLREQEVALRQTAESEHAARRRAEAARDAAELARAETHIALVGVLAHARAAVVAARRGSPEPLAWLTDDLNKFGLAPDDDPALTSAQIAAQPLALLVTIGGDRP
ncbi:hypothetical protein [Actinomadura harenae]|uniref:Uncharacterized protein n=1 Tax=Actinomadura harenae TaxID=2483351 RepID=A0A3M2M6I0_9ACTN|nr:hypothetical protein [Actinomadura harenae]RMI45307.1 hypothetical protein EBO15_10295 [Actinomadura harenae]